jgi:transposase
MDMSVFADGDHCASWAGVSPGNCESAGKQFSGRHQEGEQAFATNPKLTQAAGRAARCKDGYLRAFFFRVKARRGWGRAIFAVAHQILLIAYSILKTGSPYHEPGGDYFDKLNPARTARRLLDRLERLGLNVAVVPTVAPSPGFQDS